MPVWTLDPSSERAATRVALALLEVADPELSAQVAAALPGVRPASADLRQASALFARIVDYVQAASTPPDEAS